jgi:flagellar biosynthesis protein FlhB
MAEDSDLEKTEDPSPQKLEKAREDGQVPRSRELATFALLAIGLAVLWVMAKPLSHALGKIMVSALQFDRDMAYDPSRMLVRAGFLAVEALRVTIPLMGALVLAALLAPLMLGGWLFSTKALGPKFSRLNPASGLAKMFSFDGLGELGKALLKSIVVGGIGAWAVWRQRDAVLNLLSEPLAVALPHMAESVAYTVAYIMGGLFLLAAIDVPWQLWRYTQKLKMTKEEQKKEHKESEGDPHVKGRIRAQQREAARRRMMSQVPQADVVVTNPTHFAVALKYEDGKMGAPRVIAKGRGPIALRIRELAEENKVPRLEAPPLARALYHHVDLEAEIPIALYGSVAEVLAWVYQLKQWNRGEAAMPTRPEGITVPESLQVPAETEA